MNRQMNGLALRMWQSVCVTVVAWTRTRISSSCGTGRSTSSIRSTFGLAVPVVDYSSHAVTPIIVRTTFPVFCPVSTYLVASTTSSKG